MRALALVQSDSDSENENQNPRPHRQGKRGEVPTLKVEPTEHQETKAEKVGNLPKTFKRTTVGLEIVGAITLAKWLDGFRVLDKTGRGHQWWIGDALNEGETRFHEEYSQAIDPIEEARRESEGRGETYQIYQHVACHIPLPRRRGALYFGHHQAVAYMESEEEQEYWLNRAEKEKLSVAVLRRKIKKAREGGAENEPALDIQVLQDPRVRQWLDEYRSTISAHDDKLTDFKIPGTAFLHVMSLTHIEHVGRQLDRTLAEDCGWVKKGVTFLLSATIEVIAKAMKVRGYFMSKADLADRLTLLVDLGEVKKEKAEEERHEGQRGDVVWSYKMSRNGQAGKEKDEDDWF